MKKFFTPVVIISAFLFSQREVFSQNTGINANGAAPDVSAMLDVDVSALAANNKKGLLIPRVALTAVNDAATIPTPATSLLVYCTGTGGLSPAGYYYNSGTAGAPVWVKLVGNGGNAGTEWLLAGNTNTNPGTDFLGTTDAKDLQIKTAGVQRVYVRSAGTVNIVGDCGVGTTLAPVGRLEVDQGTGTLAGVNIQCSGNAAGTGTALNILKSGAPTGVFTSYGIQSSVTTTTNSTNVAGYFSATGGATANYAIIVPSGGGNVGIGLTAPVEQLQITNNFRLPVTTGSTVGVIMQGADRFIHNYSTTGNAAPVVGTSGPNLFLGYQAGNFTTSGAALNTGIGYQVLTSVSTGRYNTAVGCQALQNTTTGRLNTGVGLWACQASGTCQNNTAVGAQACMVNTGGFNTAVGMAALSSNVGGIENVSIGDENLTGISSGDHNTFVGGTAGFYSLAATAAGGSDNTAIGYSSILQSTTVAGSQNTAVGSQTLMNLNLTGAGAFGYLATSNANNKIVIGTVSNNNLTGGYGAWQNFSDGRFKENVKENVPGLAFITKLRPVTYNLKTEKIDEFLGVKQHMDTCKNEKERQRYFNRLREVSAVKQTGFIAQEVEATAKEIGYEFDGVHHPVSERDNYSLGYSTFVVPLVKAVQELSAKNEEQQKMIEEMQREISSLKDKIGSK